MTRISKLGGKMPKTIVFDLDGTLADTSGDLIAAANAALVELGHTPQLVDGQDAAIAVRGGRAMLQLGFERLGLADAQLEARIDEGYQPLLKAYETDVATRTSFYPGAIEAVSELRVMGYLTAICTNKPEHLAEMVMQDLAARDLFDALIGADTLPVRKPDPAPYRAAVERAGGEVAGSLLVGDTVTDQITARAAEVPFVFVGFGPGGQPTELLEADAVIEHFEALPRVVRLLLGD